MNKLLKYFTILEVSPKEEQVISNIIKFIFGGGNGEH